MSNQFRTDPYELTAVWHRAFDVPILAEPGVPDPTRVALREVLMREEFEEWNEASAAGDLIAIADALADLEVVLNGTALEYGIPLNLVRHEVYKSNMSKLMPDGSVRRREDGKVLKGPNFVLPDITAILEGVRT